MKKILVLGAGLVGSAIAKDLAEKYVVTSLDASENSLKKLEGFQINRIKADFNDSEKIKDTAAKYDLVVGAVPGFLGYKTLKNIIETGVNIVDISFFPEDPFDLYELAKKNNVTAIVDFGVAPGMDNLILGYLNEKMKVSIFECLVGGLPKIRTKPFEYKAPFSPADVIEEYTRPARFVENGEIVTKPPLTDAELVEFDKVGTLESFNTDGLRSLLKTMNVPNMKEKTLRYPGHIEYIKVLKDSGFFDEKPLEISGKKVKPLNFTSKILFDKWKLGENEPELTVMRVSAEGTKNGVQKKYVYELYDEYNEKTGVSSMARTTGYAACAAANLVLDGKFNDKGIIPPEYLGKNDSATKFVFDYLSQRNIEYKVKEYDL